jgi:acyl-CoA synthetase (AMP-forming)/AMP-acid ligase II
MAPTTTRDLLVAAAAAFPDREAYVHGDRRVTYAELDRMSAGAAATLAGHGVGRGDVVVLMLPSGIDFAVWYLGALRIGATASAVNQRLGEPERASILRRTVPVATVTSDPGAIPVGAPTGTVLAPETFPAAYTHPAGEEPALDPGDPACIVWTSGTTGDPKGAVYDHARLAAISENMGELTADGDRRLVSLPFAHVGYMTRIWDELAHGTTLVLTGEPWSAGETLRLLRDERITVGTGVPTQWELVLAHPDLSITDCSALRICGIGGSAVAPDLVRRMREALGCPVMNRYTSTEAGVTTGTRLGDPDDVVAETVGRPATGLELRLVVDDRDVPVGEVGEIVVRSPMVMAGYWRDPDLTATVLDPDGWLHTGDLGRLDERGDLRIVGRLKEMYIRGGYNVYPAEVEHVLADHPQVQRVAIVGVPAPVIGEIGVAFVVPTDPAEPPDLEALRSWCRERIADYKAPERLRIVEALPVTSMMKVDKRALAARAEEES